MEHYLNLAALAQAVPNRGWAKAAELPLLVLASELPRTLAARDWVAQLATRGTCPLVCNLLEQPLLAMDVRRRLGVSGEQQLASAIASWLQRKAAMPPGYLQRVAVVPATAAAGAPAAKATVKTLAKPEAVRPGTTTKELDAWSGKSPWRKMVRTFAIEDLRLDFKTHVTGMRSLPGYTTLESVLCHHSGAKAYSAASSEVLDATLALFRLAEDPEPTALRQEAERLGRSELLDPELEALRQRLLLLRARARAHSQPRPTALMRLQANAVSLNGREVSLIDADAIRFCPEHFIRSISLTFPGDTGGVYASGLACGAACPLAVPAIDCLLDLLHGGKIAKELTRLAHVLALPAWQIAMEHLDEVLRQQDKVEATAANETVAWRVDARGGFWDLEPVWLGVDKKGAPRLKKAMLKELRANPDLCTTAADARVAQLLRPDPAVSIHLWSLPDPMGIVGRAMHALIGHPHVISAGTDAPLAVRDMPLRLAVESTATGGMWLARLGNVKLTVAQLLARIPATGSADFLLHRDDQEIHVTAMSKPIRNLLEALARGEDLPPEALAGVLERLPQLTRLLPIELPDDLRGRQVPASLRPVLRLDALPDAALTVEPLVRPIPGGGLLRPGVGAVDVYGQIEGERQWTRRDLAAEVRALDDFWLTLGIERLDEEPSETMQLQGDTALDIVTQLIDREADVEVLWAKTRRVTRTARAEHMRVEIVDRPDWFAVRGGINVDGANVDLAEVLAAIRNGRKYVQVTGELWLQLSADLRARLERAAQAVVPSKDGLSVSPLLAEALDGIAEGIESTRRWRDGLARMKAANDLDPQVPVGLLAELRPYQIEGFRWLARLAAWSPGALLADDMGLGKTLQALALLLLRRDEGPALVVAPTSVEFNWLREAERFAPGLSVRAWRHGDRKQHASAGPGDVVVVSYDLLVRDLAAFSTVQWSTLVCDEAQCVKNATTHRWKAITKLKADFRLGLTGTPVENHIGELWAVLSATVPGLLGPWKQFHDRFGVAIERDDNKFARQTLGKLLRPFLLRRLKSEVARDLPPRTEIRVDVEPSEAEQELYDQVRRASVLDVEQTAGGLPAQQRRFKVLAAITRLRQLSCHPKLFDDTSTVPSAKLEHVLDLLAELRAEGHRALVFSQFVRHLALVRERLDAAGVAYRYLDGSTAELQRRKEVDAFQRGEGDVFLISLKAGGTGLNLTGADYVIHLDPWWNPAVEDQATDRAHRIGQTKPVTVYRLVMRGTIEESILDLHTRKRDLVASLLDGTGEAAQLSTDDLLGLLGEAHGKTLTSRQF